LKRSSTTATLLQTLDSKLVSLAEHSTSKALEDTQHEEALNSVLKEVAERLREKQNASKRAGAAGRTRTGWTSTSPEARIRTKSMWLLFPPLPPSSPQTAYLLEQNTT
jgi:hypothetical protein